MEPNPNRIPPETVASNGTGPFYPTPAVTVRTVEFDILLNELNRLNKSALVSIQEVLNSRGEQNRNAFIAREQAAQHSERMVKLAGLQ